ncbi:MAG: redox-sensing transcriptional repressor Rex [Deltaproteobacteria bacterium]|nr:redox-sensing transcriptional repressor Rex [Deltaproteobacteria bacterium]
MKFVKIPSIAIARLSVYARNLDLLDQKGVEVISSGRLADICGVRGVGYYVQELLPEIRKILGLDKEWRLGLVGAGNLGSALLRHAEFIHGSYTFVAAFDRKPKRIGATIGGVDVSPLEAMSRLVKKNGVEIGVIAVKPTWAQDTADLLVKAGVKGIMNFAPVHLQCPSQIFVENIDFGLRLERLFYRLTPPQSKRHRVHMKSGWVIAPK